MTVRALHPGVWRLRLPLMRSSEKMHEAFLVRSAQIRDNTAFDLLDLFQMR